MEPSEIGRAVKAGSSAASALGLRVADATVIHNSNRIAVRLTPCDVLARVAPLSHRTGAEFEVEVARQLAETGCPLAELEPRVEPRVYVSDGFATTLWAYYEPVASPAITAAEYADTLVRFHAGLRQIDVSAPRFTNRVAGAQGLLADHESTPELVGPDRELLSNTLSRLGTAISAATTSEQLLHGEPHLGNVLRTWQGPLLVDLETCCRGPVEFDIAHGLLPSEDGRMLHAEQVCGHYPAADEDVVNQCRILIWAMITTWRWQRDDQLPNRQFWRTEGLNRLRAALEGGGRDVPDRHD